MVEYTVHLDSIFHSLADPIRRDILRRVAIADMSISELAEKYTISFAAVSKHLKVLEKAKLVIKKKEGKKQIVTLSPTALKSADEYLEQYRLLWQSRHDKLEQLLRGD